MAGRPGGNLYRKGKISGPLETLPPEVTADAVIGRLKLALGVRTDAEIAELLGVARNTIANWRQRNSVPYEECLRVALNSKFTMDFLLTGAEQNILSPASSYFDSDLLALALLRHERSDKKLQRTLSEEGYGDWQQAKFLAFILSEHYAHYRHLLEEAIAAGSSREEFLATAERALTRPTINATDR